MKELVEVLAQSLVDHPEAVTVTETEKDDEIILELKVDPEDMGKVIGKQGRIAKAIRAMVKAAASRTDKKVVVEIGHLCRGCGRGSRQMDMQICPLGSLLRGNKTPVPFGIGAF